ncbi:mucin-3A [Brachyhypopomus gauderio]|uniref:mucin-3A n=1 Tax=Brachyhypopomus gauderio TaxID=698409 RepID=UPI004041EC60
MYSAPSTTSIGSSPSLSASVSSHESISSLYTTEFTLSVAESTDTIPTSSPTTSAINITSFFRSTAAVVTISQTTTDNTSSFTSQPSSQFTDINSFTAHSCMDTECQCNGSPCFFNMTTQLCTCKCSLFTYGHSCNFAVNTTTVTWSEGRPTRKANISLRIMKDYILDFQNLNSQASKQLIAILTHELSVICKRADPQNFRDVNIITLINGSIIVKSSARYNYPNNQSQIDFLNNDLELVLNIFLYNFDLLKNLREALGNASIQDIEVTMTKPEIANVSDIKPFINCSMDFANFTLKLEEDAWECEAPCKMNPNYCHHHGDCLNFKTGPVCQCYESYLQVYSGARCELYHRGAGFYAALFGSLGGAFLLLIISITVIFVMRRNHGGKWTVSSNSDSKRFSIFDDDTFNFSDRGQAP